MLCAHQLVASPVVPLALAATVADPSAALADLDARHGFADQYDYADEETHFAADGALMAVPDEYYRAAPRGEPRKRLGMWARIKSWFQAGYGG
jgi:hypothetical protein